MLTYGIAEAVLRYRQRLAFRHLSIGYRVSDERRRRRVGAAGVATRRHDLQSNGLRAQNRSDVAVLVLFLKHDIPLLHLLLVHVPHHPHRGGWRVGNDKGLQLYSRVAETLLDLLDRLVKLNLWIIRRDVPDAFRVNEDYVLVIARDQPQNEVGMKVPRLEEADAASFA